MTLPVEDKNERRMKHLVVLMLENRSFDHMLGMMRAENPEIRGVSAGLYENKTSNGEPVLVGDGAKYQGQLRVDPGHDFSDVFEQMYGLPFDGVVPPTPRMSGFVRNYEHRAGVAAGPNVMCCFRPDQLPVLSELARNFAICDQWFSSVPGPTLPNRAFAHFGTSFGRLDMSPEYFRAKPSIFHRLKKAGRRGKIYYYAKWSGTLGMSFLLSDQRSYFGLWEDFKRDCRKNKLPEYSFIEPAYSDHNGTLANDQHPDHNVYAGDRFIAEVYNALRSNDEVWQSTILLIIWDEHGGLYDHEIPPVVLPDGFMSTAPPFQFDRLGVRVPAVVVSPYIKKGTVDHTVCEHASIPATATEMFIGDQRNQSPYKREQNANTFYHLLTLSKARTDVPDLRRGRKKGTVSAEKPASSLLLEQVTDLHNLLIRYHPEVARGLNPADIDTEADAQKFIARAMKVVGK